MPPKIWTGNAADEKADTDKSADKPDAKTKGESKTEKTSGG